MVTVPFEEIALAVFNNTDFDSLVDCETGDEYQRGRPVNNITQIYHSLQVLIAIKILVDEKTPKVYKLAYVFTQGPLAEKWANLVDRLAIYRTKHGWGELPLEVSISDIRKAIGMTEYGATSNGYTSTEQALSEFFADV